MKKVLKITGIVVLALVIGFAGLAAYVYFDKPEGIAEYNEQDIQRWMMDVIDRSEGSETRYFCGDDEVVETINLDMNYFLMKLSGESPRFRYDVVEASYSVARELSYITVTMSVEYDRSMTPYKKLKVVETPRQALSYILEEYDKDRWPVYFLCDGDEWTEDVLHGVVVSAGTNAVNTSALVRNYRSLLFGEERDEYKLAIVEFGYKPDRNTRFAHNSELNKALAAMEADIRGLGLATDKELYTAIGKAIARAADYDDALSEAVTNESRDEDGWTNSSAYGAVVSGKTICTGYAMAYKALCDRFSLPCWLVNGSVDDVGHAWNMIQLDGETFYADCTFFDTSGWNFPLIFPADKLEEYGYMADENQVYLLPGAA